VFRLWADFGKKYCGNFPDDQPFLSLALEKLKFIPHTLSRGYNYRGMGEVIGGIIRIWHSHFPVPDGINITTPWPPRCAIRDKTITPEIFNELIHKK